MDVVGARLLLQGIIDELGETGLAAETVKG